MNEAQAIYDFSRNCNDELNRPMVYLACPYSIGNKEENVRNSIYMAGQLTKLGFCVYNPLLNHYAVQRTYEELLTDDMRFLANCQALYRMPGDSRGADREVDFAAKMDIPVFMDLDLLLGYFGKRFVKATGQGVAIVKETNKASHDPAPGRPKREKWF